MIKIFNLWKSLGGKEVLRGLDLHISRGMITVIIGGSGSGKTVLLRHLIGLLKPDAGSIFVDGVDITKLNEIELNEFRKKFGMLFQSSALFDSLRVGENVGFPLKEHTTLSAREIEELVREKLALVGLFGVEHLMPAELSGGMRKRVGLARAIIREPEIILYDEPTTGLDPIMVDAINRLIMDLQHKLSITTVVVTHDMSSTFKIAHRIAMLYGGSIIAEGTTEEIQESQDPVVQQFIHGLAEGPIKVG
ncbi:MAG: ABC transporter ATP-binding protein [candidate division NC10 bacterium]|nr:ABC transporter ATP-binding protein [candidate division NC10 bacterium]